MSTPHPVVIGALVACVAGVLATRVDPAPPPRTAASSEERFVPYWRELEKRHPAAAAFLRNRDPRRRDASRRPASVRPVPAPRAGAPAVRLVGGAPPPQELVAEVRAGGARLRPLDSHGLIWWSEDTTEPTTASTGLAATGLLDLDLEALARVRVAPPAREGPDSIPAAGAPPPGGEPSIDAPPGVTPPAQPFLPPVPPGLPPSPPAFPPGPPVTFPPGLGPPPAFPPGPPGGIPPGLSPGGPPGLRLGPLSGGRR